MKDCSCGIGAWRWELDDDLTSWIRCAGCGDNMFDKGIGVILINWDATNIDEWNLGDALHANKYNGGVVLKNEN